MLEDDGTNPFGDPRGPQRYDASQQWAPSPEWLAEMAKKYSDPALQAGRNPVPHQP